MSDDASCSTATTNVLPGVELLAAVDADADGAVVGALAAAGAVAAAAGADVGAALVDAAGAEVAADGLVVEDWDEQAIKAEAIAVVTIPARTRRRLSVLSAIERKVFGGFTFILPLRPAQARFRLLEAGRVVHVSVILNSAVGSHQSTPSNLREPAKPN